MNVDVIDLYMPTEEGIKESISLPPSENENSEDSYYLPTDEEAKEAETIFSFGNALEDYSQGEKDDFSYLPTEEEAAQSETIFSLGNFKEGVKSPDNEESICQEEQKEEIIKCPSNATCLSDFMELLPAGIIECFVPQIGVIETELKARRNSIIVLTSTKDVGKYLCDEYYIIGYTSYGNNTTLSEQIIGYINKVSYIKILLFRQDLPLLADILGTFEGYFFMVENMDILLYENSYKGTVEGIFDYYFMCHKGKRCFFTSDSTIFHAPQLANEQRTIIKWKKYEPRNLQVYEYQNIVGGLVKMIHRIPACDKVIVIYTSVQQARLVILNLPAEIQEKCGIVCSSQNERLAGDYYNNIEKNMVTTDKRITFWCIKHHYPKLTGKYHLITVSDAERGNTILSLQNILLIQQIVANPMQNILSNNIIYNKTKYYAIWEEDYKTLLQRANKIIQLTDAADMLSTDDSTLGNIFNLAKTVIKERAKGKITGRFAPFPLLRKDINGKIQVSYMSLASMKFRTNLIYQFYSSRGSLAEKLKEICSSLCYHTDDVETDITDKQKEAEKEERKLQKKYKQDERISCLEEIEKMCESGKLTLQLLNQRSKRGNNIQRKTYKEMALLYNYMEAKELISLMKELKTDNSIAFKNLNNAIMFWALADDHPFKEAIDHSFPIGLKFTNQEIVDLLVPIVQYHLHKDWTNKPRKVISFFKSLVNAIRPRNYYITLQDQRFTGHKDRIPKNDNNLLKYFMC